MNTTERFWSKVDCSGDCWEWLAARSTAGYGRFYVAGRLVQAHRFAYEDVLAPIPNGLTLDHLCRNRACVNPAHLEPVTNRENILRGVSSAAQYATATRCLRNHALRGANLRVMSDGSRRCRACEAGRSRAYRRRQKAIA